MKHLKFFLIVISLVLFSCETPEHVFTVEQLKIIDSLYKLQEDTITYQMDRVCDTLYWENFPKKVDSIKLLRQKEILEILSK